MNPLDLPGPQFLVFYWALIALGLLAIWWLRARTDVAASSERLCGDPYQLAFLRDGHSEVVRVALLTLVEDRFVDVKDRGFSLAPKAKSRRFRNDLRRPPIEKELLTFLAKRSATIDQIIDAAIGYEACELYRVELEELRFLRSRAQIDGVRRAGNAIAALLLGVAIIKFFVALSRHRYNVGFLILSAIAAFALTVLARSGMRLLTTRGEAALNATGALLAGAQERLKQASGALHGRELAWIAAAFGFSVFNFTSADFAFWPALALSSTKRVHLFVPIFGSGFAGSGTSCGTFAGSSCGGGGSSCGGGGGGGGCGGCGGG